MSEWAISAATFSAITSVEAVAVSADGRHVLSGSRDKTVKVWELGTGREACSLVVDASVFSCAWP